MLPDDPRQLWLAFGSTDVQPIEPRGMGWRVGPALVSQRRLAMWKRLGWVEQTPEPSYLYLTPAGWSAVQEGWER